MAKGTGREAVIGFSPVVGNTWDTAVACGARHGLLVMPPGGDHNVEKLVDDSLGTDFSTASDNGLVTASRELSMYARYMGIDRLLYAILGTSAQPTYTTPSESATADSGTANTLTDTGNFTGDSYAGKWVTITGGTGDGQTRRITSHTDDTLTVDANWTTNPSSDSTYEISNAIATKVYTPTATLEGIFGTLAIGVGLSSGSIEDRSIKLTGLNIKQTAGGVCIITFRSISSNRVYDSSTNTVATLASVTIPETANRLLSSQCAIWMNAQSGGALSSGDAILPSEFEFNYEIPHKGDANISSSGNVVDEPLVDGPPVIKLMMTFPNISAFTAMTDLVAQNAYKLQAAWTGALLAGSTYRSLKIEIGNMEYVKADAPVTQNKLTHSVEFVCHDVSSAPTGMSGLTDPFRITVVNGDGGDPSQAGNI